MSAEAVFRISVIGSRADISLVEASAQLGPEAFIVTGFVSEEEAMISAAAPDVAVLGPDLEAPLPLAREIRLASPQSQIVFLLHHERLERFRATLPFVPNLASAWTADVEAGSTALAQVMSDAARTSRSRSATAAVLGRINRRLDAYRSRAAESRHSQLALSERYLATILSQSPDAFVAVDLDGAVIASNEAAVALLGQRIGTQGTYLADLLDEEQGRTVREAISRAAAGEALLGIEVQIGRDEEVPRFAEFSFGPVHDQSGAIATVSITARDISERKEAEQRQLLLVGELNHRVKNTLAVVKALAQQSFKEGRPLAEEKAAFDARLSTLAAAHDLLTSKTWKSASLSEIVESSLAACGADDQRVNAQGPEIMLPPKSAVSLAIALHELCTNAIKYGSLSVPAGRVTVEWALTSRGNEEHMQIKWTEYAGPRVETPQRRGFGLRMLEQALASELQGEVSVEFREEGIVCRLDAPLPRHDPQDEGHF